jgi:phosphomannomutase
MPFIASISGIRGTLKDPHGLTPELVLEYVLGLGVYFKKKYLNKKINIIIARDGRASGETISKLIIASLNFLGIDTIDIGQVTTPTAGIFVKKSKFQGAVVITASHNPENWNGLKFLNEQGEFLSSRDLDKVYSLVENKSYKNYLVLENKFGKNIQNGSALDFHIKKILSLKEIKKLEISKRNLKVAVDGINSVGGPAMEKLLKVLGVKQVLFINKKMSKGFGHNPEPLEKNLTELKKVVIKNNCDLGVAVDPDGDRLALMCENGKFFGEENTLVTASKYILEISENKVSVSNLSSSQSLKNITESLGGKYFFSKVGEINVVEKMKKVKAVIGGEGNGGVIFPNLHYMRDSLVGISLILSYLSTSSFMTLSKLKDSLPHYVMLKEKLNLSKDKLELLYKVLKIEFKNNEINEEDGLKIIFIDKWVHLRPSNTEPICRVYIEAKNNIEAKGILDIINNKISNL